MIRCDVGQVDRIPIDMLPDDVLLAIFDFYVKEDQFTKKGIEAWQSLVHVCQLWRNVVFGSPRRLNLRLLCTPGTQSGMLDVWPALPLVIRGHVSRSDMDNIISVLERSDRVCRIDLDFDSRSQVEKVWAAMQEPFPELACLKLFCNDMKQVVPDSLLGGLAPRLRFLQLDAIPFPGLPKLLLSTTHLVALHLSNIPNSGYFSPEAIVTALSRATGLNMLSLGFQSLQSPPDPDSRYPLPPTPTVLPALTYFDFTKGASEYLEALVAHIDAPRLKYFHIFLFNRSGFHPSQLIQFISRTPTLKAHNEAHVVINYGDVKVILLSRTTGPDRGLLTIEVLFGESDFQLSSLARINSSSLPSLSMVESLYIYENQFIVSGWEDQIRVESTGGWLDLLRPYTAVKNLYLSEVFGPGVVRALQESVGERTTVVLPTLQTVFLEGLLPLGPIREDVGQFVATRQLSGYPCAVSLWNGVGRF